MNEIESVHFVANTPQSVFDTELGEHRTMTTGDMWVVTATGRVFTVPSDVVPEMIRHWGLEEIVPVC